MHFRMISKQEQADKFGVIIDSPRHTKVIFLLSKSTDCSSL